MVISVGFSYWALSVGVLVVFFLNGFVLRDSF